jgi:AcrR family transcriptional regulator
MTNPRPNSRAEQRRRTEARILDAAARVFVADGYDRATIRAVASAAGVDGGLVTYYFGSKQQLFRAVIDAAPVPEISAAPEVNAVPEVSAAAGVDAVPAVGAAAKSGAAPGQAVEQILAALADRLANEPVTSLAILRSVLTNPEAADAVRGGADRHQAQIVKAIVPGEDAKLRAEIISALMLGITVSRHLLKTDELAAADPAEVIRLLRPCLLSLTGGGQDSAPADTEPA